MFANLYLETTLVYHDEKCTGCGVCVDVCPHAVFAMNGRAAQLVRAAKRGVRVRVLFDQLFTVSELDYLAGLALEHGNFEVRLYNPLFNKAKTTKASMFGSVTCCFTRTNQRMHNKLQVVDGVVGLTGGRNIADRYFDFDTDYDFKDREVLVYGSLAGEMRSSFD